MEINSARIPEEMKQQKQWILWQYEEVYGRTKPAKVPYTVDERTFKFRRVDPTGEEGGLLDFKTAEEYADNTDYGIGFVFNGNGFVGVDLDGVINEHGEVSTEAREIIEQLSSYTEVSPSGTGYHIICKGKLPEGARRKGFIEMYENGRYFTVTGNAVSSPVVRECTSELAELHAKYLAKPEKKKQTSNNTPSAPKFVVTLSDEELLGKARNSRSGAKFARLYDGNFSGDYNSRSEADIALCNNLAFWTACDANQMDRLFRSSGLYREKWDERHSADGRTYGEITIQKAISDCTDCYTPAPNTANPTKEKHEKGNGYSHALKKFSEVEEEKIEWIWYPYIPKGKLTILAADPGTGKTWLALGLASAISRGGVIETDTSIFKGYDFGNAQKVLYQSAEDGVGDTLIWRINTIKPEANKDNIYFIQTEGKVVKFDSPSVEAFVREHRPALVIFDPMQAFIDAKVDINKANETREIMTQIIHLAEIYNVAVLILAHQTKAEMSANKRVIGSTDIVGGSRSLLSLTHNPQVKGEIALCHTKSSLAPKGQTTLFKINPEKGGVEWMGYSEHDADYYASLDKQKYRDQRETKISRAIKFLKKELKNGPKFKKELVEKAETQGLSYDNIKRAKQALDVQDKRDKAQHSKTLWFMLADYYDEDDEEDGDDEEDYPQ